MVTIRTYSSPDETGIACERVDKFDGVLDLLSESHRCDPILIELSGPTGSLLVGVGSDLSTIEFMSSDRKWHGRALPNGDVGTDSVAFTYAGQATEVPARFLVPTEAMRTVVRAWFLNGKLDDAVKWSIHSHPPHKPARR